MPKLNGDRDEHTSEFSAALDPDHEARNVRPNLSMAKKAGKKAERIGGGSVNARLVEELEKRINKPIICMGKDWYGYEGGTWKLVDRGRDGYEPMALGVQDRGSVNARRTDDILKHFEQKHKLVAGRQFYGAIQYVPGQPVYAINCSNCVLCMSVETGQIEGVCNHAPEYMFTRSLGEYKANASCERFRTLVMPQILPERGDRRLIWDYACYCLLPHSNFQQAMFFIGGGGNGKSIIAETIANAIGRDVKSNVTLHQLCARDQKHMRRLEGMLTNVSTETEYRIIEDSSAFNALVSGESISIAEIYKAGLSMTSNAKPWFLMNHIPQFRNGSYAVSRRMLIVHFSQTFNENRNVRLGEELEEEAAGILAYIVRRMPKIAKLNKLEGGSESSQRLYTDFTNNNDIISAFSSSCLRRCCNREEFEVPGYFIGYDIIFNIFRKYCEEVGHDYLWTNKQFLRQLRSCRPDFGYNIPKRRTVSGVNSVTKSLGPLALNGLGLRMLRNLRLQYPRKLERIIAEGRDIC